MSILGGAQDLLARAWALHETRLMAFHGDFVRPVLIVDGRVLSLELPVAVILAFCCAWQRLDATSPSDQGSLGQSRVLDFQILLYFGRRSSEVAAWSR